MKTVFLLAATLPALLPGQDPKDGAANRGIRRAHDRSSEFPVLIEGKQPGSETAGTVPDANLPRPKPTMRPLPFAEDRPALAVEGVVIGTGELNQLVEYYRTFRDGADDLLIRDAVAALVPRAVMEARYRGEIRRMKQRIDEAVTKLRDGADFAAIVSEYSDDDEAQTPDGRYTFGREVAVQPFDRLAHTTAVDEITAPFLTRYGYHVLQVVNYHRADLPQGDRTEVRHVLVMFPFQAEDPRTEIREEVEGCKIRILDPALRNALPPELRPRLTD